ncbi:unnamed protein product [Ophioblennius macclurei]
MDRTRSSQTLLEEAQGEGGGGLKEVVLRWFNDTQASLVLQDGNFPGWFRGFATRKEAEELLRDREVGTFLVRLSDKTVGYVLSYRGLDRCRHFVISQNRDGLLVLSGDDRPYGSLSQLIQHYGATPIQPFGEYLTSGCHQTDAEDLYDVVNQSQAQKPGVSVRALRARWDQKDPEGPQRTQRQVDPPAGQPPALLPKPQTRKLKGTVSMGSAVVQGLPPVPRRGLPPGFSLGGTSLDAQKDSGREERLGGNADLPPPTPERVSVDTYDSNCASDPSPPRTSQSEQLEKVLVDSKEDDHASHQLDSAPSPSRRVMCHSQSLLQPRPSGSRFELLHMSRSNPLYQSAERFGSGLVQLNPLYQSADRSRLSPVHLGDEMYAKVPHKPAEPPEDTYESLEEVKTRDPKAFWFRSNLNWRKLLHNYIKK